MKTKHFYLLISMLLGIGLYAQENSNDFNPNKLMEEITSSPEVSNLGSYGDYSTNAYNGSVNISIPLHNLNFEGLQIPLNMSYNSTGVRVSQDASWVGLNWSLSSYISITRTINGADDLNTYTPNGYVFNDYQVQNPQGGNPYVAYDDIVDMHASFVDGSGANNIPLDMEADLFEVSLFGNNYKFRLTKKPLSGNIINAVVLNDNNVRISFDLLDYSFTVVDDKGFEFFFSSKEINTSFSSIPTSSGVPAPNTNDETSAISSLFNDVHKANESVITAWLLDKIVSPHSKELNFDYTAGMHFSFPDYSEYVTVQDNALATDDFGVPIVSQNTHVVTTVIENQYLNKIHGDFGEIEFVLSDRVDLFNAKALSLYSNSVNWVLQTSLGEVRISQTIPPSKPYLKLDAIEVKDFTGTPVKNIAFNHSYFNQDKIGFSDKERYLRLKLDSVAINEKVYGFEYELPNSLPTKNSSDTDFWGFYNGASNTKRVPSIGRFVTQEYAAEFDYELHHVFLEYNGANRGSNFNFGKRGILNKVTYPTGGYTSFEYESHEALVEVTQPYVVESYRSDGNIKLTNLTNEDNYRFTYQYLKKAIDPTYLLYDQVYDNSNDNLVETPVYNNQEFTVNQPTLLKVNTDLRCHTGCANDYFADQPLRVIKNINTGNEDILILYGDAPNQSGGVTSSVTKELILAPGTYKIQYKPLPYDPICDVQNPPAICTTPAIEVVSESSAYNIYVPDASSGPIDLSDYYEVFQIGGARIGAVANYLQDGSLANKSIYEYNRPNSIGDLETSGLLMDELIYFTKPYGFTTYDPRQWGTSSQLKLQSSNALRTMPSAQGSHLGYAFVKETSIDANGQTNGWKETEFINNPNLYQKMSWCRPFVETGYITGRPPVEVCVQNTAIVGTTSKNSFGYINGNIFKERIFNRAGDTLVKKSNQYKNLSGITDIEYFPRFMSVYFADASGVGDPNSPFGSDNTTYFLYNTPLYYSLKSVLEENIITEFLGETVVNEQTNSYNSTTHHLRGTISKIENNAEIQSKYYYPYDTEVFNLTGMVTLRNDNRISTPVKTESLRDGQLLGAQLTNYVRDATTFFRTLPTSVETIKGISDTSNPFETRIKYEQYGPFGKIRQVRQENGTPVSYIWGYNTMYPVAKVENASYTQIEMLSDFGNGFDLGNGGLTQAQENALRALPNAMVTTYTFKPLVGIQTMKDPRGYTITYIYDAFNLLKEVRDADNNIVTDYEYHFAAQN